MLRKEQNDLVTQTGPGTADGPAVSLAIGPRSCSPRSFPRTTARRCGSRCCRSASSPSATAAARYGLIDEFCPAPRRVAVVRPQRGVRPALPLSRLEVRRDRPVRRGALRARGERLRQEDQAAGPIPWSSAAACCGPIWGRPSTSRRCRNGSSRWCRASSASSRSGCRNATGCRRWKAASIPATSPSCIAATSTPIRCSRAPRAINTISATRGRCSRWSRAPGGLYIGARRNAENGNYYWRITQWVLPSFTMIAPRGGHTVHGHFWIPIDDENCWAWSYDYHPDPRDHRRRSARRWRTARACTANTCPGPTGRSPTRTTTT